MATAGTQKQTPPERNLYLDALRAGALLVVVFGHWIATLPRFDGDVVIETEHLLKVWESAGFLTWVVQVVPLFVFVSAAVSADGVARRMEQGHRQLHWWGSRALGLARPTVTYLAAIAVLGLISVYTGGRLLEPFNQSLTIHLWFLIMLLSVQALLPVSVAADRRWGLGAVVGLVVAAALVDLLRAMPTSIADVLRLGQRVTESGVGIGWLNMLLVWLLPQQLGIAWRRGRFRGAWAGLAFLVLGAAWLSATVASGYPVGMVGRDFHGDSNMLPPTLALAGVMWLQVGAVLFFERPGRWLLDRRRISGAVGMLSALSMPLYLWHKLAELPAAWLGERLGLPVDAGLPGEAGFWIGRLWWLGFCTLMVIPVIAAVVAFEMRRTRNVVQATNTPAILIGGFLLFAGIVVSLALGALPGALIGVAGVAAASWVLRAHPQPPRAK
ncbi:acyltransferase [Marinobacter sp.]|uniref:acyltransferase family protein n=1 Tax=Marinobacter sp. TaxID=50741 RepID=UPI0019ED866F|nr:acyltransferase [Marinobacter sp.]MBE0486392.1 acyltransferase [Marinobacter sp.]